MCARRFFVLKKWLRYVHLIGLLLPSEEALAQNPKTLKAKMLKVLLHENDFSVARVSFLAKFATKMLIFTTIFQW